MNTPVSQVLRKGLLACGILSSVLYVAMNIIVPMYFPGYNAASQTVSELSAIDAPSRQLWVWLATIYSILVIAFAVGVLLSSGRKRRLRMVYILLFVYGISGFFWPPMHQREVLAAGGGTMTDTMHIVFAMGTVLVMMLMIGFAAGAFGKPFRVYSIVSMIIFLVFGILIGLDGPDVGQNLPTPLAGVWERINIGVFLIWMAVLAGMLWQRDH